MKEGKPDELLTAWLALPGDKRKEMDAKFFDIFEMSCEKGLWFQFYNQERFNQSLEDKTPDEVYKFSPNLLFGLT